MQVFIKHALRGHNIIRAIKVALLVGTILAIINHYDMIFTLNWDISRIIKMSITYLVPFSVALYSGAMAGRHNELYHKDKKKNNNDTL
jgi:cellobiose-specific phosphotransferase system component IIC